MGELRKDYVIDRYVIISSARQKRPNEFISSKKDEEEKKENVCLFCPGSENLTPSEICRFPDGSKEWDIRIFSNKYPAVKPEGKSEIKTDNNFFSYSDAYGYHEVIVETPNHEQTLAELSEEKLSNLFKMIKKRITVNMNCPNVKYVSVFKNFGEKAGTSIKHTHCQLIAYNLVPEIILKKEHFVKKHQNCPYCYILDIEKNSLRRCFENASFVAFTPYASRFPFEIWVFPKRHILNITEFNEQEYVYLAEIMKKIFIKLKTLNADYNFYLQYGIENMHFHIEFAPRVSIQAGFEFATNTFINTLPPESAAEFYRS